MKRKRWFVHRTKSWPDFEAQLNTLEAEGYTVFAVWEMPDSRDGVAVIVSYKYVR